MTLTPEEIVDPLLKAFETLANAAAKSDKSILELIQIVSQRVMMLEDKVNLLMMTTKGKQ